MDVLYFSEQTPQERDGRGRGSKPTPLMPLAVCILMVGVAAALLQVSWASPIVAGTVVLVVAAALRNGVEEAEAAAASEAETPQQTPQEQARPDEGQAEPPFQKPACAARRFKGDHLWGLN